VGWLEAVCVSERKGTVKHAVREATIRADHGIEGDAHAGPWHRQVSLLAAESIDRVRDLIPALKYGMFGENLVTRGIRLDRLAIGDLLRTDEQVLLQATQIGNECHSPCAIAALTGDCIMPREGIFARVLRGGTIRPGMRIVPVPAAQRTSRPVG